MASKRRSSNDNNDTPWIPKDIIGQGKAPGSGSAPKAKPKPKPKTKPKGGPKNGPDNKRPQPKGPRGEKPKAPVPYGYKPNWDVPPGTPWKKDSPWNPKQRLPKSKGASGGGTPMTKKSK